MLPFPNIDPVAIHIGPLAIRWYGLSYLLGFVIAWWLLQRRARQPRSGWPPQEVSDLIFYGAMGAVLGGRLGYMLFYNLPAYLEDPFAILKVWQGGMSFHGGLIGIAVGLWLFARKTGKRFIQMADFLTPAGPVGLFLGRLANFINGELWGAPTDQPWGVIFPDPRAGGVPRHPSQLYEAFLEGLVLFVILWLFSRRPRPAGAVLGLFLVGYGSFRFLVEFVRVPDVQLGYLAFGWLTMGQVLCIPMILIGGALLLNAYRNRRLLATS